MVSGGPSISIGIADRADSGGETLLRNYRFIPGLLITALIADGEKDFEIISGDHRVAGAGA